MTTIAYRDGVLAADSRATCHGAIEGSVQKIWRVGPILFGASGRSAICEAFKSWTVGGMRGDAPFAAEKEPTANGLAIMPDGLSLCWNDHGTWRVRADFYALGSGYQFAMGAMAMGATAEQAVESAARFDTHSGGLITVLSL